jgi:hypothetical protein
VRRATAVLAVLLAMVPAGCDAHRRRLVGDVAWLLDGRIYYTDETFGRERQLRRQEPDGKADERLPPLADCVDADVGLRGLTDGAMAVTVRCRDGGLTQVLAYDTHGAPALSRWAEPVGRAVTAVWDPVGRRGFLASEGCPLERVGAHAAEPLFAMLAGGGRARVAMEAGSPCPAGGPVVSWPMVADTILYCFVTDGGGHQTLYRAVGERDATAVDDRLQDVQGAAISRDGRVMLVSARRDGEWGVWRVRLPTASPAVSVDRWLSGRYGAVAISPTGSRIAAVRLDGDDDEIATAWLD